jgi:protein-tyrosine phosphatase
MYSDGHRARQVEAPMLEEADLVLAMSARQVEALIRLSPENGEKVHTLPAYTLGAPEYEGISDPYGQPMSVFRTCARRLLDCVDGLLPRLSKGR